MMNLKLLPNEGVVGGVCAGIAYELSIKTWIVRLLCCLLIFVYTEFIIIYLLLWTFVPNTETPLDYDDVCN